MNIRLCFKISAEVGLAEDENGNPAEAYVCAKFQGVKSYNIPSDQYKEIQDGMRKVLANQLECDETYLTPITLNEYLDNTEDED